MNLLISDLLSRLQMWTISAEIINISNLPALTELNQASSIYCVHAQVFVMGFVGYSFASIATV